MRLGLPRVNLFSVGDYQFGFGGDVRNSIGGQAVNWLLNVGKSAYKAANRVAGQNTGKNFAASSFMVLIAATQGAVAHQVDSDDYVYDPSSGYLAKAEFRQFVHEAVDGYKAGVQTQGAELINNVTALPNNTTLLICDYNLGNSVYALLRLIVANFSYNEQKPFHLVNMRLLQDACALQNPNTDNNVPAQKIILGIFGTIAGVLLTAIGYLLAQKAKMPSAPVPLTVWGISTVLTVTYFFPIVFANVVPTTDLASTFFSLFFVPVIFMAPPAAYKLSQSQTVQYLLRSSRVVGPQADDATTHLADGDRTHYGANL
jgi:hypothetical protein